MIRSCRRVSWVSRFWLTSALVRNSLWLFSPPWVKRPLLPTRRLPRATTKLTVALFPNTINIKVLFNPTQGYCSFFLQKIQRLKGKLINLLMLNSCQRLDFLSKANHHCGPPSLVITLYPEVSISCFLKLAMAKGSDDLESTLKQKLISIRDAALFL